MRITSAELVALRAKRAAPTVSSWRDGVLTLVIPGVLKNPLNQRWHHYTRARWSRTWHEKTAGALLEAGFRRHKPTVISATSWHPSTPIPLGAWRLVIPRLVRFHASVQRLFDSDGLQATLKPCRDALVVYGVLSDDAERAGHAFEYGQEKSAGWRGVVVTVTARQS